MGAFLSREYLERGAGGAPGPPAHVPPPGDQARNHDDGALPLFRPPRCSIAVVADGLAPAGRGGNGAGGCIGDLGSGPPVIAGAVAVHRARPGRWSRACPWAPDCTPRRPRKPRLMAAVAAGDPAAAQRAGERLERCDGLIFVITVPSTFRAMLRGSRERRAWLDSLPERVDQQCRAWNLSLDGDPWHGSNALVLPVRRGGEQFALRLTAPDESFPAEVAALRFWAGRGTVLLVETDLGAGTMLLERLDPTRSPATLPLAEANHHAGTTTRRLAVRRPRSRGCSAPASWCGTGWPR